MFGWLREARTCASRWNLARRSGSEANSAGRILIATSRPNFRSLARYTSPIPPTPSRPRSSYGPMRERGPVIATESKATFVGETRRELSWKLLGFYRRRLFPVFLANRKAAGRLKRSLDSWAREKNVCNGDFFSPSWVVWRCRRKKSCHRALGGGNADFLRLPRIVWRRTRFVRRQRGSFACHPGS